MIYQMSCERLESDPCVLQWYIRESPIYTFGSHKDNIYRYANWWSIDDFEGISDTGYLGDYWWLDVTATSMEIAFRIGIYKILKEMRTENQYYENQDRYEFNRYTHIVTIGDKREI